MEKFVHLNVKSEYSLLNGITKTSDIINTVKNFDIPAVALTDLNNMHNAYHFGEKCKKAGVKHIIGVTFCVQYSEKEYGNITLLAKNTTGYKNLVCLSTLANKGEEHTGKNGFPYITLHQLAKYPSGLICLTGGSSGIFFKQFNRSYLETLLKIYGQGNVYFEFQNHKTPEEKKFLRNPVVYQTLQELNIEPVATNDVYYLKEEHAFHRSLALQMNPNPNGIEFTSSFINRCNHFYLKTPEEMIELFQPYLSLYPNILSNTVKIAEECKATVPVEKALPEFPIPDGYTNETYLRFLCEEGFHERFDGRLTPEETKKYRERLDYEFGVIKTMGFIDYHLITADFIQWAKDDKVYEHPRRYFPENTFPDLSVVPEKLWKKDYEILVGPGRGSAAGSLLCYCLKITNLDPIADGLLFERFLNVERVSMPKSLGISCEPDCLGVSVNL